MRALCAKAVERIANEDSKDGSSSGSSYGCACSWHCRARRDSVVLLQNGSVIEAT
jgi:hypothetical protein